MEDAIGPGRDRRMHQLRSSLLGVVSEIEDRIDLVLAASLGRDAVAVWSLYVEVLPRTQVPNRLALFKDLLARTPAPRRPRHKDNLSFAQARPLLFPLIEELVKVRNVLAHAIVLPLIEEDSIQLRHRRSRKVEVVSYEVRYLEALIDQGFPVLATLDDLLPQVADLEVWASIMGFDER